MSIITRKILKNDLTITVDETRYDYDYIIEYTNRAKTYFITHGAKAGQKVLLLEKWPNFISWFIAGAELGLSFVIADSNSKSFRETIKNYGTIDFVVNNIELTDNSYGDIYWASDNDVLIYTTSSGTTGSPKTITYTHEFLLHLAERNSKIYKIQETDTCAHTHTLSHSSVVGVYFLPSLMSSSNHYFFYNNFSKYIRSYKVNYCLVLRDHLIDIYENFNNDIDYECKIFVISKLLSTHKTKIVNDCVKLISIFGCSETMGPLFLSEINNDNKTTELCNFGKPLDDYYKIDITSTSLLKVTMPTGEEIFTGDKMYIDEKGDYIFVQRAQEYIIDNERLCLDVFNEYVSEILNCDFDLVVDEQHNQIYIRANTYINLDNLNTLLYQRYADQRFYISKQLVGIRENYMNNVKFDANLVRIKCRECN